MSKSITVGLELPGRFNKLLDHFDNLNSTLVKSQIRSKLTEDIFWCEFIDGRQSDAMLSLLVNLIHLKYQNPNERVSILNLNVRGGLDEGGAEYFAKHFISNNNSSGFILTGNYHARLAKQEISLSNSLKKANLDVIALNLATKNGHYTSCFYGKNCELKAISSTDRYHKNGVYLYQNKSENNWYDGDFFIKKITGANPAENLTNDCKDTGYKFTPFD